MPSRAKMTMERKSSSSRLAIERIEFNKDATRLRSEDQYLGETAAKKGAGLKIRVL